MSNPELIDEHAVNPRELAYCSVSECLGAREGFLYFEETECCPWCGSEQWSVAQEVDET